MKNPFPPKMPPEFIPYKAALGGPQEDLYRGLAVWRGHESIVIRKEDLTPGDGLYPGDYGVSDDDWVFAIRDTEHVATARVSSQVLSGRLYRTPDQIRSEVAQIWGVKKGPQALDAVLDFCTKYPTSEESIRGGSVGSECCFQINGKCFPGESTIIDGKPIVFGLDTLFMEGPPEWWTAPDVRENLLAFTDIWERLGKWFIDRRDESRKAAIDLPRQCEHCHGAGTVPR